jgi:hypothetical protein
MLSRFFAVALVLIVGTAITRVQERPTSTEIVGHIVKPQQLAPAPQQVGQLKLPPDFEASVFAQDLGKPRMLAIADDGIVYVTRREPGDVLALRDTDGDGRSDQVRTAAHIQRGKQYGWPYVFANGKLNPQDEPPAEMSGDEWARLSENPVAAYTAHSAPMQMVFCRGNQFPSEFRGDAFVAMRGSRNRRPPSGYEVVRVRFRNGAPEKIEPFLTGFLTSTGNQPEIIGRPVGVAVDRQGALLISDEAGGRIFRVTHRNRVLTTARPEATTAPAAVGTTGTLDDASAGAIAMERSETKLPTAARLAVTSPEFQPGGTIPTPYTDYGERFSPPLRWSDAPATTKSFVLLMEDPDAKAPKPYVHWLLYNVPAATTGLPESIPATAVKGAAGCLAGAQFARPDWLPPSAAGGRLAAVSWWGPTNIAGRCGRPCALVVAQPSSR